MPSRVILVDTNVILEAVRTRLWNAISGQAHLETVQECVEECLRGDRFAGQYVSVEREDLRRLECVRTLGESQRAALLLKLGDIALDDGECDLYAHGLSRIDLPEWRLASPDRAAVRAAVRLGWGDRLLSLEELAREVGCPPARIGALRPHFESAWLRSARTDALLEEGT